MSDQGNVTFQRLRISQEAFARLLRYIDDAFLSPYFQPEEVNGSEAGFSDLLVMTRCYAQGVIDVELYNASMDDFQYPAGRLSIQKPSASLPSCYLLVLSEIAAIEQQNPGTVWVPDRDSSGVPVLHGCADYTAKAEPAGPCPVCAKMKRELDAASLSDYWHKFISQYAQARFNVLKANKSLEATPTAVTPAADAPGAPSAGVPHH